MESAEERDELGAAGRIACEFDGRLDCLRARVAETHAARAVSRRDGGQLFRQSDQFLVIEISAGHVDQPRRLPLDRLDNTRMAMPGGHDRDSGVEIEEPVSIYIL